MPGRDDPFGAGRLVTRPFLVVTSVTFLFFLYVGVQIPLLPRLIERGLGGTELDIGLNLAAFSIAAIAIRPLLGPWGDRYGRRSLMIIGALLAGIAVLGMTLVSDRWLLLPLRGLAGIGEGGLFVGAATMISDLAPPHRRAEAASYFSVAVFAGIGIGPIISEMVVGNDHYDRGLLVASVFALAAAACAFSVPENQLHPSLTNAPVDLHEPVHLFHRAALRPGIVLALAMAGFATFTAFVPGHASVVGLHGAKWVFALYSVVCLVVRIVGARLPERLGLRRTVAGALVLLSIGLATISALATPFGLYAGTVLVALGMAFVYPALMAITVNAASEMQRARGISTFTMFFEVGAAFGGIAFGAIAEVAGKRGGFLAGAASAAIGLWVLWKVLHPSPQRSVEPAPSRIPSAAQFTDLS